jgi:hypothetical protein
MSIKLIIFPLLAYSVTTPAWERFKELNQPDGASSDAEM